MLSKNDDREMGYAIPEVSIEPKKPFLRSAFLCKYIPYTADYPFIGFFPHYSFFVTSTKINITVFDLVNIEVSLQLLLFYF